MVRVKICGNRRAKDALWAADCGADAIGLLVGQTHASDDFISPRFARDIIKALPPFCAPVLVTHVTGVADVVDLVNVTLAPTLQLHGRMTVAAVRAVRSALPAVKLIKTVHVADARAITRARRWEDEVDALLLDSANRALNQIGGTGQVHDWRLSAKIVVQMGLPVILAGGLTSDNVADAIAAARPYGVDVNSGTKGADGFKDPEKVRRFIETAKSL